MKALLYILEGGKVILDQIMLIYFYKLLKWQRDTFSDMIDREEYYNFG